MSLTLSEYYKYPYDEIKDLKVLSDKVGVSEAVRIQNAYVLSMTAITSGVHADLSVQFKVNLDYNMYSFASFMSVESTIRNIKNPLDRDVLFLEHILRPLGETVYEDAGEDHRRKMFGLRCEDSLFYINSMMDSRDRFHNVTYRDVFYRTPEDWEKEEESEEGDKSPSVLTGSEEFENRTYLYSVLYTLSGEDILKYDEILRQPMALIAPDWSYRMNKAKIDRQQLAQQEAVMKSKSGR